jgi:hypothetical protein
MLSCHYVSKKRTNPQQLKKIGSIQCLLKLDMQPIKKAGSAQRTAPNGQRPQAYMGIWHTKYAMSIYRDNHLIVISYNVKIPPR